MAKYVADHPKIPNKPGVNWVDKVGGLPKPIDAIMRALMAKGWTQQRAVATAVSSVKKTCATGRAFGGKVKVSAEAQATACAAVASWEAKKSAAKSMAVDDRERRVIELAFKRLEGEALHVDMAEAVPVLVEFAADHSGKVPVKVQVTSTRGKKFLRTIWVRPKQAKGLRKQKGGLSQQGARVTGAAANVLGELAKIPKSQRPAGWQDAVRAIADPKHHGRLGPAARKALHALGRNAAKGSPLHKAVYGALGADSPKGRKKMANVKKRGRGRGKRKGKAARDRLAALPKRGGQSAPNPTARAPAKPAAASGPARVSGSRGGRLTGSRRPSRPGRRTRGVAARPVAMAAARRVVVDMAAKQIPQGARDKAAAKGQTAYNGSFPIRNVDELKRAIQSIGRAPADKRDAVKKFIVGRAKTLGRLDLVPASWKAAA
jgi:hypothetical protein